MNREWSELNKEMQAQLKKRESFDDGIKTLLSLRAKLIAQANEFREMLSIDDFRAIPFLNADGYHSKTIAYSLYHIARIEDIVANSLIRKTDQIFFDKGYRERMNSSVSTTGNELVKEEIAEFSRKLNIDAVYEYVYEVSRSTNKLVTELSFDALKTRMSPEDARKLHSLNCVSENENAVWLIEYWCGKDVKGLIQMPFSRHWIMHIEACLRIRDRIQSDRAAR